MHHQIVRKTGYNSKLFLYLYAKKFWFLPWSYQTCETDDEEGVKKLERLIRGDNKIVARYKNGVKIET